MLFLKTKETNRLQLHVSTSIPLTVLSEKKFILYCLDIQTFEKHVFKKQSSVKYVCICVFL